MSILNKTKKDTTKPVKAKKADSNAVLGERVNAIIRPRITEKAAILAEKNTYVFEVSKNTNKIEIAKAVKSLYGVTPIRVNIVNLPVKRVFVRGKNGVKSGVRKALVTLKADDKIEIV